MPTSKRYIALFGPRNAGKTVFLASLYGFGQSSLGADTEYHIAAPELPGDATHAYLSQILKELDNGKWPDASKFQRLPTLNFAFTIGGDRYDVVLPDVAGEVTRRAKEEEDFATAESQLKAEILRDWQDYHGYLLFVPSDEPERIRAREYKWEVDALLNALKERTADGGIIRRPIAVILSKWDLQSCEPKDEEEERSKAEEFFYCAYPELAAGLKATCGNLQVFPVSATGPLNDGIPPHQLRPYNLGKPISWLLNVGDQVRLDSATWYIERYRHTLFTTDSEDEGRRTHYAVALARLDSFLKEVPAGFLADQARTARTALRKLRRRRLVARRLLLPVACLLLIAAAGGLVRDWSAYKSVVESITSSSPDQDPHAVILDGRSVVANASHVVGKCIGWWGTLGQMIDDYEDRHINAEVESLERESLKRESITEREAESLAKRCGEFRRYHGLIAEARQLACVGDVEQRAQDILVEISSKRLLGRIEETYIHYSKGKKPDLRKTLLEDCKSFLASYSHSQAVETVQKIQAELENDRVIDREALSRAELEKEAKELSDDPWKAYLLYVEWLARPENARSSNTETVAAWRDDALAKADDKAWADVLALERRDPTYFQEIVSRIDSDYLTKSDFTRHILEAKQKKTAKLCQWDKWLYEQVVTRALGGNTPEVILGVRDRCKEYKDAPIPERMMDDAVDRWLDWFNELQAGVNFSVTLKSVRVSSGSRFHSKFYWPNIYITIRVGGTSHSSGTKELGLDRDERNFPDSEMGTFHWKWGDPDIEITMTCIDYYESIVKFTPTPTGDPFKIRFLNGSVPFDGGKIPVHLECRAAVPPTFPAYREKK